MNSQTDPDHHYPFHCPQCGGPTHGSSVPTGEPTTFCEDCLGDRDFDDPLGEAANQ